MKTYKEIGERVGQLVDQKNQAYGSSFDKAGDFLKLLYPNGITPEQYSDMLCLVRIFDKQMRIATNKDAFGESPYGDIAGYAILGLGRNEREKEDLPKKEERHSAIDVYEVDSGYQLYGNPTKDI